METVTIDELEELSRKIVSDLGYEGDELEVIVNCLVWAQLRDNNNSCTKLVTNGIKPRDKLGVDPSLPPEIVHETPVSARMHGRDHFGMVVMNQAIELAISKAKISHLAVVTFSNTCTSTGAMGYWLEKMADEGMIGMVMSQSPELVAPHGSVEAIFGTNPIGLGVPRDQNSHILLDMATSGETSFHYIH